jgi:integrase
VPEESRQHREGLICERLIDERLLPLKRFNGTRVGELLALKWEDINFTSLESTSPVQSENSGLAGARPISPGNRFQLAPELAEMLWSWKLRIPYKGPRDWVSASPHKKGRQPYWPGSLFRAHVVPALKEAGITASVGWHTLRHTFGTLMNANGEDLKTIQEMLRHATFRVTADIYTQAITDTKREPTTKSSSNSSRNPAGTMGRTPRNPVLLDPFGPTRIRTDRDKFFGLLASPTGFEPVLPP